MRTNTRLVLPFFYALLISACSNNDNYPKEYIGFEKQFISHTYDTKNEEETLTLKIIAAEKKRENYPSAGQKPPDRSNRKKKGLQEL